MVNIAVRRSGLGRFVVSLAAVGALGLAGCKKPDASKVALTSGEAGAPVAVETAAVVEQDMPELITLTGSLRAHQESEVAADAAGKVMATFVERGQKIKKGDTVAVLDARGASLSASAASAQSKLAVAQLEQAQRECDRVKALFQSGSISQAEYDRTTSQCQTTEWSAAAAAAQQRSAQKLVGDSVIRAPFDGIVGERYVNVGQYVQPPTRVLSLYATDPLRLELTVPEASVGEVKEGLKVAFSVSSFGEERFEGTVKFVSPNVRPSTRDLVVEALVPNEDGKLRPGMFAVATLQAGAKKLAVVPSSAIQRQETTARVFVVESGRIQERLVQTGGEKDAQTAILAGVKPGEQVVVAPGEGVRDGAQVQ